MSWSLEDLKTVIKEGIPYADISSFKMIDNFSYSLGVEGEIKIPVHKIEKISCPHTNIGSMITDMVDPILKGHLNVSFGIPANCCVVNDMLVLNFSLILPISSISTIARDLANSHFYSALEKALED